MFRDLLGFGGSLVCRSLSIMLFAFSPNAVSSPKKSGFIVLGSTVNLCHVLLETIWFYVFSSEYNQYIFQSLSVGGSDITECLQQVFK